MSNKKRKVHQNEKQNIQKNASSEKENPVVNHTETEAVSTESEKKEVAVTQVETESLKDKPHTIEREIEERLNGKYGNAQSEQSFRGIPKTLVLSIVKVALPIAAFIVVVAILVHVIQKKNQITEEAFATVESSSESVEYAYEAPLEANTNDKLTETVHLFYQALAEGNMEEVTHVIGELDDVEYITYQKKSEMIESYDNITCYTKPGLETDQYFLYVYYEAKLQGAQTAAPGLNTWYAYVDEAGEYRLQSDKNMSENVNAALKLVTNQDDVVDLFNKVDVKYNEAITSDEELNTLLANMLTKIREEVGIELAQLESSTQEAASESETETSDTVQVNETVVEEMPATIEKVEQVKTTDTVRVRSSDSTEADLVGKAPKGTTLTRTEEKINGWSKVIFEGKEAYIKSDYLEVVSTGVDQESIGVVKALENVNVRSAADQEANRIGGVQAGTSYNLLERLDGWYKIDFNGKIGYVKAEYFE